MDEVDRELVGLTVLAVVYVVVLVLVWVAFVVAVLDFSWCRVGFLMSSVAFMEISFEKLMQDNSKGVVFSLGLAAVASLVVVFKAV